MWALFRAFLLSILFGGGLHLVYDGMRIALLLCGVRYGGSIAAWLGRIRFPFLPPDFSAKQPRRAGKLLLAVLIFISDVLFCVTAGFLFSFFLYTQNDGQLRLFLLLGAALGFFLFHITIGRLLLAAGETIAFFLRLVFAYFVLLVRVPTIFLAHCSIRLFRITVRFARRLLSLLYFRLVLPARHVRESRRRLRTAYIDLPTTDSG